MLPGSQPDQLAVTATHGGLGYAAEAILELVTGCSFDEFGYEAAIAVCDPRRVNRSKN
jgi:hypothetical protein